MFFLLSISIYFFHNGCSRKEDWVEQVLQLDVLPIINFHLPFSQCYSKKEDWVEQVLQLDVLPIINFHLLFSQWLQ